MFNSAFDGLTGDNQDFYPSEHRDEIDAVNARIYDTLNNGVYRSGFSRSQAAYDEAVGALFETLDWIEERLSKTKYLVGDTVTLADWRLLPTLLRFDSVYHTHFKCNRSRIVDFPNLWDYTRALFQWPGVAETMHFENTKRHYFASHESINPSRIVATGPKLDWMAPSQRG